jgi:hypothetical protein
MMVPMCSSSLRSPSLAWMSGDGEYVFFDTDDALVPQDTNGTQDVYEWEDALLCCSSKGLETALRALGSS